jgi:hypothetical protein
MIATSAYKMSKEIKTMLSHIADKAQRNSVKRLFIAAELAAAVKPKIDKKLVKEE